MAAELTPFHRLCFPASDPGAAGADWKDLAVDRITCPKLREQFDTAAGVREILCGVLDTDPNVPLMTAIATAYPAALAAGLEMLAGAFNARSIVVAADPAKARKWFSTVRGLVKQPLPKLIPIEEHYPQADPTLLLYSVLGRRLKPGTLPTTEGVLLVDAAAAVAVGRSRDNGATAIAAVRDHRNHTTYLVEVPAGTRFGDVMDDLKISHTGVELTRGDFLRDIPAAEGDRVGGGELVFHVKARRLAANPDPCIRCGWCVEACPTRVHPAALLDAAQRRSVTAAAGHGLDGCIECGICSYLCPTRLPLLEGIRLLKTL